MDLSLRSLEREAWSDTGDLLVARRYQEALERQRDVDPSATLKLDQLQGALSSPGALGEMAQVGTAVAGWRRARVGGRPPLLEPRPPAGERLAVLWRARGIPRWCSSSVVLLEVPAGELEARCPRSGRVLWSVDSADPAPALVRPHLPWEGTERWERLGWAVAPWGAVRLSVHVESELLYRRVGRHDQEWGRITEREVVGRGPVQTETTLQVVLPGEGGWSAAPPTELRERSVGGEPVADSELCPSEWEDDLLLLSLDQDRAQFAVSWRDEDQDWEVFSVVAGPGLSPTVGAAGWSVSAGELPFPCEPRVSDPSWALLDSPPRLRWDETPPQEIQASLLLEQLEGRALRSWSQGLDGAHKSALLLPVDRLLLLQLGEEELVALGGEGS